MALIPLRSNNAYIGFSKQNSQGVAVAPSVFPRWQDGSSIEIDLKTEDVKEGDTSRHLSLVIKNGQHAKIKLLCTPRPNEVGMFEQAAQGIGSDTATPATVNTTLSATVTAGAASLTVPSNTGLTGSGTIALAVGAGLVSEEIPLFTIPATGTGPYTLAVNNAYNGGKLAKGHTSGATIRTATTHTLVDTTDGSYYTAEVSLGGTAGTIIRVTDCKLNSIKRSGKAGGLLLYEMEFDGCVSTIQGSAATVSLEMHNPFLFTYGVWTLDGATTGDAPYLEQFSIEQKNNNDVIQTERLTPDAIIFGMEEVDVTFDYPMQDDGRISNTYFGSPTGTTDAQPIGTGSLHVVFSQPDSFHTVTYDIPYLDYIKAAPPAPKADGKHFVQQVEARVTSNQGANPTLLTSTVTCVQATAF